LKQVSVACLIFPNASRKNMVVFHPLCCTGELVNDDFGLNEIYKLLSQY